MKYMGFVEERSTDSLRDVSFLPLSGSEITTKDAKLF
jgi:hypothetical protein